MVEALHAVADDVPPSVRSWRNRLAEYLREAASRLEVTLVGDLTFGLTESSVGCRAVGSNSHYWLRVIATDPDRVEYRAGASAATAIEGVAKPSLLRVSEWTVDDGLALRAELLTLAPSPACSSSVTPTPGLELPDRWWASLRRSLDALASWPTERTCLTQEIITTQQLVFFGRRPEPISSWSTAHGDLHWANLTAPECCLLDWESWGRAPTGYDAAALYCVSLVQPTLATRVWRAFADILEGPAGTQALLCAAAKTLTMVHDGLATTDLAEPVHRLARRLLG